MSTNYVTETDFVVLHYLIGTSATLLNFQDESIVYAAIPKSDGNGNHSIPLKGGFQNMIIVNRSGTASIGVNIHTNGTADLTPANGTVVIPAGANWEVSQQINTISIIASALATPVMLILTKGADQ